MTKAELVVEIAKESNLTKAEAEGALNAFVDVAKKTLKEEGKFTLAGFGSFVVALRKARKGRNPQTGEPIEIKEGKAIRFRPGKSLKEGVE